MVSAIFGPTPGRSWATRKPATRSRGFSAKRISDKRVLDVRRVEEFEAAEFHERDVAPGQLQFERRAVVRGAEQHRLRFQRRARFPVRQHRGCDIARLVGLLGDGDERRRRALAPVGPKVLGEALGRERDHRIGGGQDRLGRAIVAIERDDARRGSKLLGKSRMLRTVAARKE